MHKIGFGLIVVLVLLSLTVPASAQQGMNSYTVGYDPPGATGTSTLEVNASGGSRRGQVTILAEDVGSVERRCLKARRIAKDLCRDCGGTVTSPATVPGTTATCLGFEEATCSLGIDDFRFTCQQGFRGDQNAGTDEILVRPFGGGTLYAARIINNGVREREFTRSASAPKIVILSLNRQPGASEGDVELIFDLGPPLQRAITTTLGKSPTQVLRDLATQLPGLGVTGGRVETMAMNSWAPESHVGDSLVILELQFKPVFGFVAPAGWTIVADGAQQLRPPKVPAVTGWGVAGLISLLLLAGVWLLHRGMFRTA